MVKIIDTILYWLLERKLAKRSCLETLKLIEQGKAVEAGRYAVVAAKFAFQLHPRLRS